jgi:hypothetical protein
MNTLLLISFCFVSCVVSIDLYGVSDDQIRSCLLGALKRFHEKSPPLKVAPPSLVQTSPPNLFERFPFDVKNDVLETFVDLESLLKFKQTSKHNSRIPDEFLFRRLSKFNPYYLVEDPIVNKLLILVISKHFVKSKNLQSPHIYDELELLILKFTIGKLNFEAIPKRIYFYLIAFINETVYGSNSGIKLYTFFVLEDFATKLRLHEMPESLQFFKDNKESFKLATVNYNTDLDADLDFLHSKPTKEEIRAHFALDSSNSWSWLDPPYPIWIISSVFDLFADEISDENFPRFSTTLSQTGMKPLLERFLSLPNGREIIENYSLNSQTSFSNHAALCTIYKDAFNIDLPECYFYTRSVLNEFSLDGFQFAHDGQLEVLCDSPQYNLYMIEMLTVILRSGLISDEDVQRILNNPDEKIFYKIGDLISL